MRSAPLVIVTYSYDTQAIAQVTRPSQEESVDSTGSGAVRVCEPEVVEPDHFQTTERVLRGGPAAGAAGTLEN